MVGYPYDGQRQGRGDGRTLSTVASTLAPPAVKTRARLACAK
jgi:hypothetical protein